MYQATINRQYRDVQTLSPKVLLTNITKDGELFRDHCWVEVTDLVKPFIPRRNGQKLNIQFEANTKEYQVIGLAKLTLKKLNTISIVK